MQEKSEFERVAERLIVDHSDRLLEALEQKARKMGVDDATVQAAIERFSGGDLADYWWDWCAEAEVSA